MTSDSVSMMVEVARARKPLAIHRLPERPSLWSRLWRPSRDLAVIPEVLRSRGQASWLGEPFVDPAAAPPDETRRVAERVRRLVEESAGGTGTSFSGSGV